MRTAKNTWLRIPNDNLHNLASLEKAWTGAWCVVKSQLECIEYTWALWSYIKLYTENTADILEKGKF